LMRAALETWLDQHPSLAVDAPALDLPAPTAVVATNVRCGGLTGDGLESCTDEWSRRENARFLLTKGLLVLLLAFGAWVLVLALITWWRRLSTT